MTAQAIPNPLPIFTGLDGRPLDGGYVYFGELNQDPRQAPKEVFWDADLTVPATQALRTLAGYISHNGGPANVWVDGDCSILVLDSLQRQVFYMAEWISTASAAAAIAGPYATAAAASAAAAATSAAAAQAAQNIFSTTALGISGTTNGKYFGVLQAYSEGADIYLNSSGTAVATGATIPVTSAAFSAQQIQVAELSPPNLIPYPYQPMAEIYGVDTYDRNGLYLPNRATRAKPSGNLVARSSGSIQIGRPNGASSLLAAGQFEFEEFYANGPAGNLTAARVLLAAGKIWSPFREILPAGTYTCKMKAKAYPSTTPTISSGDQAVPVTVTNYPLTDSVWTTISFTITANGSSFCWPLIINNTGATVQFLLDEVQIYAGASVPAYNTEVNNVCNIVPQTAVLPGKFKRSSNSVDTNTVTPGVVRFDSYPLQQSISELTIVAVVAPNDNATAAAKVLSLGDAGGTLDIGTYFGAPFGNPAYQKGQVAGAPDAPSNMLKISGRGYHILATRVKANQSSFFWNNIELEQKNTPWGPVSMAKLSAFTDSDQQSFPFKGKGTIFLIFKKWLSNAELTTVCNSVKQRHALFGEPPIQTAFNFMIAEGDSISDPVYSPGGSYVNLYFDTSPINIYCKNHALASSTFSVATSRLPAIQRMAPQVLAATGKPLIVSAFLGAAEAAVPSTATVSAYWAAVKATGAKLLAFTLLPKDNTTFPAWESARQTLNTWIRANSSLYDGLCDFGANASIMGDPNSHVTYSTYWTDNTHPNLLGHQTLMPTFKAAIEQLYS